MKLKKLTPVLRCPKPTEKMTKKSDISCYLSHEDPRRPFALMITDPRPRGSRRAVLVALTARELEWLDSQPDLNPLQ